jgi:hypothetical protein
VVEQFKIRLAKHKRSDLLMAVIEEVPGFIVHAYSEDELLEKIGPAFEEFMNATGRPVSEVEVVREETSPPDFWPPAYLAKALMQEARG